MSIAVMAKSLTVLKDAKQVMIKIAKSVAMAVSLH
jgi:hypothetical protein